MTRRKRWTMLTSGAIAAVAVLIAAKAPTDKPECEIARDWAEANAARLPTTLEGLSSHSLTYRRAIYVLLPASVQRDLWRTHLASFLGSASTLDAEQRSLVEDAMANIDQYAADTALSHAFHRRARAAFTTEQGAPIFATLGSPPTNPTRPARGLAALSAGCNCELGDSWCWFEWCVDTGRCTVGSGCGTFWTGPCNGTCGAAEEMSSSQPSLGAR